MLKKIFLALLIIVFIASGCGGGTFNPFKKLGVDDKDIPEYKVSSEITFDKKVEQEDIKSVWSTIEPKAAAENGAPADPKAPALDEAAAKKMLADYINKKMKEKNSIVAYVKTREVQYTAEYYQTEAAAKLAGKKLQGGEKFPVIYYEKEELKKETKTEEQKS